MLRPTAQQLASFANMARQYPEFVEFLEASRMQELEVLPYGVSSSLDVLRGRVQTLTEIRKVLSDQA